MKINIDTIVRDDNPIMRKHSEKVELPLSKEDEDLLMSMYKYVVDSHDEELCEKENLRPAVGIAAVQVGVLKRMCAISAYIDEDTYVEYALVNPRIVSNSVQKGYLKCGEGCLSVDEFKEGYVVRSARVTIKGYDLLQKKDITIRARGYEAIILQHELDHFDGVLYYDRINKENPFTEIADAKVVE